MTIPIDQLSPQIVWKYFQKICSIPHGSGNEAGLAHAISQEATKHGCSTQTDAKGNLMVQIPATPGCEDTPTLVLQGHLDMVCEKNSGHQFDFSTDPILPIQDGEWVRAQGTSLGSDNGIGLSVALSFMEPTDVPHGPLQILATVEEETGLYGAQDLDTNLISGRLLFNMDSEEDGVFYVGCAGGRDSLVTLPVNKSIAPKGLVTLEIVVSGLLGGHSGLDIVRNRANAIKLLAHVLTAIGKPIPLELVSISGGDKHNAIPREATGCFMVPADKEAEVITIVQRLHHRFMAEYGSREPDLSVEVSRQSSEKNQVFTHDSRDAALGLLMAMPHGISSMMQELDNMVETSTNLANVRCEPYTMTVLHATRSSIDDAMINTLEQIEAVARLAGANFVVTSGYPSWKPNMASSMLKKAETVWEKVHGNKPAFQVIHAGLECGIIGKKFPGMEMISLGPTIENPHSPTERVSIRSVERFFDFCKAFVSSFTKDGNR